METLHLVFKTLKAGNVSSRKSRQFMNEMHFYGDIIPTLETFERASNVPKSDRIDGFGRYFGSRLSLDPGKIFCHRNGHQNTTQQLINSRC